jgi:hypothetical protein
MAGAAHSEASPQPSGEAVPERPLARLASALLSPFRRTLRDRDIAEERRRVQAQCILSGGLM